MLTQILRHWEFETLDCKYILQRLQAIQALKRASLSVFQPPELKSCCKFELQKHEISA